MRNGHNGQSGIQNHSIGDIFPFSIRSRGHEHLQLIDCRTGNIVWESHYENSIQHKIRWAGLENLASRLLEIEQIGLRLQGKIS